MIKEFEEYIEEGIAIKITPDVERAKNIISESERKYLRLNSMIKKLGVDNNQANDYIEYCYNILIYLVRAQMLIKGYSSSGKGAHEAEVAYTKRMNFSEKDIKFFDQLRYFRNGVLYYGKQFDKEYAEKVIEFTKKNYSKLKDFN